MLSKTERPHIMALTMELNLSSRMTMSEAPWATLVPVIPMARPTSAALSAGASFVPSPVTPTTSPPSGRLSSHSAVYPGIILSLSFSQDTLSTAIFCACVTSHSSLELGRPLPFRRVTIRYLSSGDDRAITWILGNSLSTSLGVMARNVGPSMASPPSVRIPHCLAMARAVLIISPVTMRTVTPARWAVATASFTSLRRGSMMPTMQSMTSFSPSGALSSQSEGRELLLLKSR